MFWDLPALLRIRVISYFLLAAFAAAVCNAQAPSSASSTTAAGKNAASPSERVVLKVGNLQITQADFETMVSDLEAQQGPAELSRRAIGDNYAQLLMLSQQAAANHLESSPEVIRQLALDRTQIMSNAEFARLKSQAKPSPDEISAYYSAHLADYDVVGLRRVFIWSSSDGQKDGHGLSQQAAKALADRVRNSFASKGDVAKVLHDTPHGPEDVLFDNDLTFQRGELPAKMEQAVFPLKEGEWVELNDAPGTYVFLQVAKRSRRDLKDVSPQIEQKLQAQKLKDELNDLKKNAGIWMDQEYFAPPGKTTGSNMQSKASATTKSETREDKDDKRQN